MEMEGVAQMVVEQAVKDLAKAEASQEVVAWELVEAGTAKRALATLVVLTAVKVAEVGLRPATGTQQPTLT